MYLCLYHRFIKRQSFHMTTLVKFWNDHIPKVTCVSSLNVRIKNYLASVAKFMANQRRKISQ